MECEQLTRLIKDWYIQVKQETMAPARMMQFVDQHVKTCKICAKDLILPEEIEKIREFVFPESKILKPIQAPSEDEEEYEEQGDDSDFVTDDEGEEEDELDDEEDI